MIEYIFTLTVGFRIAGRGGDHFAVQIGGQVARLPASASPHRSAVLKCAQKPVAGERINRPRTGIPLIGRDVGKAVQDADFDLFGHRVTVAHSSGGSRGWFSRGRFAM